MKQILIRTLLIIILLSSCTRKYPLYLGEKYKIDYDGNSYFYLLDKNNTIVIESHITKFDFDSVFIIIEQKPVELILDSVNNIPNITLRERDRVFKASQLKKYWIILNKKDSLLGPFSEKEYSQKRKEFRVSQGLVL